MGGSAAVKEKERNVFPVHPVSESRLLHFLKPFRAARRGSGGPEAGGLIKAEHLSG